MISSLVLALRFLTVVPVPGREADGPDALGRAAWWFPVVGLGLGAVLVVSDRLLSLAFPPPLAALLVLSLWKLATGGIHLDGLADCLDGLGGHDRPHRLAIMRDSRVGAFGAIGLILCFLAALLALAQTPDPARGRLLALAPVAGRVAPLLVGPRFRVATPGQGAGSRFLSGVSAWAGPVHLVAAVAVSWWLIGPWGPVMMLGALVAVVSWSAFMVGRLGGLTGDVLGSGVELGELAFLLAGASLAHRGLL